MKVIVDGTAVFEGRSELPTKQLDWFTVPIPRDLVEGNSEVDVQLRLTGIGNQHDQYFEVGGTTRKLTDASSHFLQDGKDDTADLSPDPGTQSGRYLIEFVDPAAPLPRTGADEPAGEPSSAGPGLAIVTNVTRAVTEDDRWTLWRAAITSFAARPLFGAGFYSSNEILRGVGTKVNYANFHNQFLQFLSDSGFIGITWLIALFLTLLVVSWRLARRRRSSDRDVALALTAVILGIALTFLLGSFLADSRIAGLLWVVAGLVAVEELLPSVPSRAGTENP